MRLGNTYIGMIMDGDYSSIYLFPFGIEILVYNGIRINFILAMFQITLHLTENITLFWND